ncbi:hypothetical protein [Pseudomonas viridiflava]|uniref:hypothetical protein n=1 Tax=Pseudomonas viridiflava TaxID=33069 RepID=UPI000F01CB19|nr:hypothetical protein [Pseudomonas viridiflava]
MVEIRTAEQAKVYASVSDALIEEGYEDLLTGEPEGVRQAMRQMILDAELMATRASALKSRLDNVDDASLND